MLTTASLITFLQLREGYRKRAYDDAQPDVELTADTEIKGTITIGYGTTRYPDGSYPLWSDRVSQTEATDYLTGYIRETIEPALENLIHVHLEPTQYDALASLIYQYGEPEVAGWRLVRRINKGEDWEKIAMEWVSGTVMWRGSPAFWGRRVAEVLMFLQLDWRAAGNVPPETNILDVVEALDFDGKLTPQPAVDTDLFDELEIPRAYAPKKEPPASQTFEDPTPDTPLTTEDLNTIQLIAITRQKNTISAPKLNVRKPPKAMEDSQTHRGLSKKESGQEAVKLGAFVSGGATVVATVDSLTRGVERTQDTAHGAANLVGGFTLTDLILIALFIGVPLVGIGLWRWYRGQDIADDGRRDGTQTKI